MKVVVAAFNQEKALVGAFSVITNLRMELFEALLATKLQSLRQTLCINDGNNTAAWPHNLHVTFVTLALRAKLWCMSCTEFHNIANIKLKTKR